MTSALSAGTAKHTRSFRAASARSSSRLPQTGTKSPQSASLSQIAQNSWFSPPKIADTESSAKTFMIVAASSPDTVKTVRLLGC